MILSSLSQTNMVKVSRRRQRIHEVAAAAILHAFADAGQVAMGVVSLCPYRPACLDAINPCLVTLS